MSFLPREEIIIINWARQVGKTSLLQLITKYLLDSWIKKENVVYINLEDFDTLNDLNNSPKNIEKYLKNKEKYYIMMDEIQYLDDPSHFLKYCYDTYRSQIKLIVTWSSSLEIKAKLQDSLVWRKVTFQVNPLSFSEFLLFKKSDHLLNNPTIKEKKQIDAFLEEYLIYWWLPKIALENNTEIKKKLLKEYVSTYINKDVRAIGNIENIGKFNQLLKLLSNNIGQLINIRELSNTLNISQRIPENYIDILLHTFVFNLLNPYFTNIRKQVSKMPKWYFFDLGIRNTILGNFSSLETRWDSWQLFENFCYLEMLKSDHELYFYRTLAGTEIDFIIKKNEKIIPVEIKFQDISGKIWLKWLVQFCDTNNLNGFLINKNYNSIINKISYVDYTKLEEIK